MDDSMEARIEALERAVTDGDHDLSGLAAEGEATDRLETLEETVSSLEDTVRELEAGTQALRGYVGNLRSVNHDVEQRADAALAKAESLESRLSADSPGTTATSGISLRTGDAVTPSDPGLGSGGRSNEADPKQSANDDELSRDTPPRSEDGPTLRLRTEPDTDDPEGVSPPAERAQTQSAPTGGTDNSSGGVSSSPDRCASCGRPRTTTSGDDRESTSDARGHTNDQGPRAGSRRRQSAPSEASRDADPLNSLVASNGHDEAEEAGTIERIRRML